MHIQAKKVYVIIPTIRDLQFLKSWKKEFINCHLIVVEDSPVKSVKIPNKNFKSIQHFCWQDIDKDLGKNSWIISRKNAGIRSYGFLKAYQQKADVIITLDDDCYPVEKGFVKNHLDNLDSEYSDGWSPTYPNPKWMFTRGVPYRGRLKNKVVLSHGLWSGALDLDATTETKLKKVLTERSYPPIRQLIPKGNYYPMCSMNMAFKAEITPAMFFPMMGLDNNGKSWGFDRYDDIWAGLFSKKIIDHLGKAVVNGSPFINHKKASIPSTNFKKEASGMKVNEFLWKSVDSIRLTKSTVKDCYIEIAKKIKFPKMKYFNKLKNAMVIWAELF